MNDLFVEVNREFSSTRQALRNQKALVALLSAGSNQAITAEADLVNLVDAEDSLRYLIEAVKAKSSNLRMTSSDFRLLYSIMEQQLKIGEVYPSRVPGKAESEFSALPTVPEIDIPKRPSVVQIEEKTILTVESTEAHIDLSQVLVEDGSKAEQLDIDAFLQRVDDPKKEE